MKDYLDFPSGMIRADLRFLKESNAGLRVLHRAVEEGEASGYSDEPFDFDTFVGQMRERHGSPV